MIERDAIVGVECDIWIPAARPNVLHAANVDTVRARIVAQGANIPATPEAEARLHERGVLVLPDFIANAGGVICGAIEYAGGTKAEAFRMIDDQIRTNTTAMLEQSSATGVLPRAAALTSRAPTRGDRNGDPSLPVTSPAGWFGPPRRTAQTEPGATGPCALTGEAQT